MSIQRPYILHTIVSTRSFLGGPSRSVPALCDALSSLGADVGLMTSIPVSREDDYHVPNSSTSFFRVNSDSERPFNSFKDFRNALRYNIRSENLLIHDHGVWLPNNHAVARHCRDYKIPRVVSPRGMLADWAMRNKYVKKRLAWILYQWRDLRSASGFHVTSDQEAAEVRRLGFRQPIAVIPNGLNFPDVLPERSTRNGNRALFLSRVNRKKGIDILLSAWSMIEKRDEWKLAIVGPCDDDEYLNSLKRQVDLLGLAKEVSFFPECTDTEKWQYYRDSDLFILPSHNENFGNVIVEAMLAGLPIITTTGTPWSVVQQLELGWWIDSNKGAIGKALREAFSATKCELSEMGNRAALYARENFAWNPIAERMLRFYGELSQSQD